MSETKRIGKYEILEELGRGGFAVVYKARDVTLNRLVALKVLFPHLTSDPKFVQRFQQEAQTAAQFHHPHIVTIHEVGQEKGIYYLTMTYLEGRTLDKVIAEGSLTPEQTVAILEQIAGALDLIHSRGLVHRDIKPANIMIGEDGQATLLDFGIVRAAEGTRLTTTMAVIGTPEYMSPEQAEENESTGIDWRADLYALSVVAYEMLVRKPPFSGSSPSAVLYKHVYEAPPRPTVANPALSPGVEAVLLKGLAKKREERFQKASDFARQLRQVALTRQETPPPVHAKPVSAKPISTAPPRPPREARPPMWPQATPSRTLLVLIVSGGGLLLLGLLGFTVLMIVSQGWRNPPTPTPTLQVTDVPTDTPTDEVPIDEAAAPKNLTAAVASDCSKVTLNWTDAVGEGSYRLKAGDLNITLRADSTSYTWASPPTGDQTAAVIALKADGSEIGRVSATFAVSCVIADGPPDLEVESISFDRTPVAFLPVHVTVRIKNSGGAASGFKLHWWGGKNFSNPSCEWNVGGGLGGGGSADMECDFVYSSSYGSIFSRAQIDVSNAVAEADEGNNVLEKETPVVNPVVAYDFVEKASAASWKSGSDEGETDIPWNGDSSDARGFARWATSDRLETGGTLQGKCLETYPRRVDAGWIAGTYTDLYNSGYVVQKGDRFHASVGLLEGAGAGNVTFRVMLRVEGGSNQWIAQVDDTYGNGFQQIDVDLSPYAGRKVSYVFLRVDAGDSAEQDRACWITAVIYRYP